MRRKIIAYIAIVALVFTYMFFRETIYYSIQETDGFYIDIGHEAKDTIADIETNQEDIFIISTTRAKSGGQSYHAYTKLSGEIKVIKEINLDHLIEEMQLPKIKVLHDLIIFDDLYILYESNDDLFVIIQMDEDANILNSVLVERIISPSFMVYQSKLIVLVYEDSLLSTLSFTSDLIFTTKDELYTITEFSIQDAVVMNDSLYMLFENGGQYGLHQYDLITKETTIGAADPKVKEMVVGDQLYLLEFQGDYITKVHTIDQASQLTDSFVVEPFSFYQLLYVNQSLLLYGAVNVGNEIHASYGYYQEDMDVTVLDVPYSNTFVHMIPFQDRIIAVMRTNYLMDYEIRKTIYTLDDVLYVFDQEEN